VVQWSSEWNRRLDTNIFPSWIRLVLWDLSSGKRIYVSPTRKSDPNATRWEVVRVSGDGSRLAVGAERTSFSISILSVLKPVT
jgi:hypothetical protein